MLAFRTLARRVAVLAVLTVSVAAQSPSFNIDIGANGTFPAPSAAYGGAIAQPGTWNSVSGVLAGSAALVDLSGAATAVTISQSGGVANVDSNNGATNGDDENLLDDAQDIGTTGTKTWTISGLPSAYYRVIVFAWGPDNPVGFQTSVQVVGGALGAQTCGGAAFTGLRFGTTHVGDSVNVTGGTITIQLTAVAGNGRCNGIQLQRLPAGFGTVLRAAANLTTITGEIEHQPIAASGGEYALVADTTAGGSPKIYRIDSTSYAIAAADNGVCALAGDAAYIKCSTSTTLKTVIVTEGNFICVYTYGPPPSSPLLSCVSYPIPSIARGIAYGSPGDVIYFHSSTGQLFSLNSCFTAAPVAVGSPIPQVFEGLGWDPANNMLWGFARINPAGGATDLVSFAELDPATGLLTGKAFRGVTGLATPNIAGGCDIHVDPLNPTTYSLAAVHLATAPGADSVVVYDIGVQAPLSVTYCTAGTSTNGCNAILSSSGVPSASAGSGFVITASGVEGQKTGLIFYGITGQASTSWGGGSTSFLCVKSPTQRTPPTNSGGTPGSCTGSLSLDWNAYIAANPTALGVPFSAGSVVDAQAWYRDPPAPKTTNLSDGLEFTVTP